MVTIYEKFSCGCVRPVLENTTLALAEEYVCHPYSINLPTGVLMGSITILEDECMCLMCEQAHEHQLSTGYDGMIIKGIR